MKNYRATKLQSIALLVTGLTVFSNATAQQYTRTLEAAEDTYVNSNSTDRNTNYGASTQLRFRYSQNSSGSNYNLITYLKFNLKNAGLPAGAVIDSVALQASVYSAQTGSNHIWHVLGVNNNSWTEATATWNNRPAPGTDTLSALPKPTGVTFSDSTPYRATWPGLGNSIRAALTGDSLVSLALYTRLNTAANVSVYSKEWPIAAQRPQLLIHCHVDTATQVRRQVESRKHNLTMVYFLPAGMDTVPNYRQRLNGIMLWTQDFYRKWMTEQGFPGETVGLNKDAAGLLKMTVIRGQYDSSYYPYDGGGSRIIPEINAYFALHPAEKTSTHMLVLTPQYNSNPFYGLGNGWCFAVDNPNIDTSYFATGGTSALIGGLVHELGHGLNLPHDKEKVSEKNDPAKGTSLMGSGNQTWGKKPTFVTQADCATLHTCEVFRTEDSIPDLYGGGTAEFTAFSSGFSNGYIHLSGKYTATKTVSNIIAYNDQDDDGANYDQLAWVVNKAGTDSFYIDMPIAEFWKKYSTYTLRMKFLFANGSSREVAYSYYFRDSIPVIDINFGQGASRPEGLFPVADTYIRNGSYANTNYGQDSTLSIKPDPAASYKRELFLKFRLPDFSGNLANVDTVRLHLKTRSVGTTGTQVQMVVKWTAKSNWDNSTANSLTWNKWVADTSHIDSLAAGRYYGGNWMSWNLSKDTLLSRIRSGDSILVLHVYGNIIGTGTGTSNVDFYSNESANAGDRPSLSLAEGISLQPLAQRTATAIATPAPKAKQPAAFRVYPNPVQSVIYIQSQVAGKASLINVGGLAVKKTVLVKGYNTIDVSGQPAGVYFLVMDEGRSAAVKVMIVKDSNTVK